MDREQQKEIVKKFKEIRLNTAFKLPKDTTERVIVLSKEIGRKTEPVFILDGIQFHPHITIYSPEYPESNIDKVLKILKEIADRTTKIQLTFQEIKSHDGYIGIYFELSPEIKSLHKEIVVELNPLRHNYLREEHRLRVDYQMDFSPAQLENIAKYGYPDAMNLYRPHLTIIRLKNESLAEEIVKNIKWETPRFLIEKLALYKMGEHGTCKKLVEEFLFK